MNPQSFLDIVDELGKRCDSIDNIIGLAVTIGTFLLLMLKKESCDVNEEKNPMYVLS